MSNYTNCNTQTKLAAVIPIKTLRLSKTRLSVSLGLKERISLSLNLLENVLESAVKSSLDKVIVLGSDHEVKKLSLGSGAECTGAAAGPRLLLEHSDAPGAGEGSCRGGGGGLH